MYLQLHDHAAPQRRSRSAARPTHGCVPPTEVRSRRPRGWATACTFRFFPRGRPTQNTRRCSPGCTILRSARFAASRAAVRRSLPRYAIKWRATPADSRVSTMFHHHLVTDAVCAHRAVCSGAVLVVVDSSRPPLAGTGIRPLVDHHGRGNRWKSARGAWLHRCYSKSGFQRAQPSTASASSASAV